MDVSAIASVATEMSQARTADAVSMAVLKKALDVQAQGAAQLVQAAVQAMQAGGVPPRPGSIIDVFG
jgi:hypothetical protein